MARTRRRTDPPLIRRLLREPFRFDFFQAVRLMEWIQPNREGVGSGMAPGREAVRFRATSSLAFPASDIVEIAPPRAEGDVPEMTVSFLGLAGTNGPLPRPFTELVLERTARKDPGMRDFLDIFHHRLISLVYRVRKKARVALHAASPEKAEVADRMFALTGLGTLGLRDRLDAEDRALLRYTALLAQRPRSMHGLERLLGDYFSVPIVGKPFVGQWLELEPDQRTALGGGGMNAVLGESAVLGGRVWDQQGKFEVVVGPLTLREFVGFLPGADRLPKLTALTRFYVGPDLEFDVRLKLAEGEVPGTRLGALPGPRLGWTSWLRTQEYDGEPEVVIRNPEAVVAARAAGANGGGLAGVRPPAPRSPPRPAGVNMAAPAAPDAASAAGAEELIVPMP
ncbi:MAG: type VI secretion system baseplate subunit TssG [Gemmatimonadota bacterium]